MNKSPLTVACTVLLAAMTLLLGCKKNQAPDRAAVPSGPTAGYRDSVLAFTSYATDPDGDSVAIRFDWGDGDTSGWTGQVASGASVSDSHRWVTADTYEVRAQAKDAADTASGWSNALPVVIVANQPPSIPAVPGGPASGHRDSFHIFTTVVADPEGDSVSYRFDWGDGDTSAWSAWLASGTPGADSHFWSANDTFLIRAQAKDTAGLLSDWSQPFAVAIEGGWAKTFGGSNRDAGEAVILSTDGGYVIVGWTESYGAGSWDVYLIKTDTSGKETWSKTFGGTYQEEGRSVQQTSDGGYIIAGTKDSSPSSDVLLVKTDASGNQVWAQTLGTADTDHGYSVQQTSDGGYIITGEAYSFGTKYDVLLIKTDALGTQTWTKTFGGSGTDLAQSVQPTSDGGYIIAGSTDSYGAGGGDAYLVKTDADGNQVWAKTFGGAGGDGASSVRQTSDGGYIVAGATDSYGQGNGDLWLVKTDASGNETWSSAAGGADTDWGSSVQPAAGGGYVVCGTTMSYGAGGSDVWLVWTDEEGRPAMSSSPYAGPRLDRNGGQAGRSARPGAKARFRETHPHGPARRVRGE